MRMLQRINGPRLAASLVTSLVLLGFVLVVLPSWAPRPAYVDNFSHRFLAERVSADAADTSDEPGSLAWQADLAQRGGYVNWICGEHYAFHCAGVACVGSLDTDRSPGSKVQQRWESILPSWARPCEAAANRLLARRRAFDLGGASRRSCHLWVMEEDPRADDVGQALCERMAVGDVGRFRLGATSPAN